MPLKTYYIKKPITILTKKIAPHRQNSFFYAGQNIAEVKVRNRTYVLTTAGEYKFRLKEKGKTINFDCNISRDLSYLGNPGRVETTILLTDTKIQALDRKGLVENWGWFGINVWETRPNIPGLPPGKDQCLPIFAEVWSEYDEAMKAFIEYVELDMK
jgi:hypothetical protein